MPTPAKSYSLLVPPLLYWGQHSYVSVDYRLKKSSSVRATEFVLNIAISTVFFVLFIAFFFFVVASEIEQRVVRQNAKRAIDELVRDLLVNMNNEQKEHVQDLLTAHLAVPDMSAQDHRVAQENHTLLSRTFTTMGAIAGSVGVVIVGVWAWMRHRARRKVKGRKAQAGIDYPDLTHLLVENLILLAFVAMTELFFLVCVAAYYQSLNTNAIRRSVYDVLLTFIQSSS